MELVKLFKYSELPNDISDYIFRLMMSLMGEDDYSAFEYQVGLHFNEVDINIKEWGEEAKDKDYYLDKKAFEWFSNNHGVNKLEKVYIKR